MLDTGRSADRSAGSVFRKCVDPRRHDIRRRCSSCHWNLRAMSGHLSRIPSSRLHQRAGLSEGDEGVDGLAELWRNMACDLTGRPTQPFLQQPAKGDTHRNSGEITESRVIGTYVSSPIPPNNIFPLRHTLRKRGPSENNNIPKLFHPASATGFGVSE